MLDNRRMGAISGLQMAQYGAEFATSDRVWGGVTPRRDLDDHRWHDLRRIRASLDRQGMFLNGYLRELFDAETPIIPGVTNISAAGKDGQELDLG